VKTIMKVIPLLIVASALTGCSASATLPEFDAAQAADDRVPQPSQLGDVDPDSTRLVGEVDDYTLFLGRGAGVTGDETLCLIFVADDSINQTACGAGKGVGMELPTGVLIEAGNFTFPEDKTLGGSRVELSDSVSVITIP
jgi:hypothetical protein